MAANCYGQDIRPVPYAAGLRAWQDRCLGRTPAQRDQRPAVRLRLRAPGLGPSPVKHSRTQITVKEVQVAQLFNASEYLLDRRLAAGDGDRLAVTGPAGDLSYAELWD